MSSPNPNKILKCHPPDVTVSVGSGDEKQQFKCYKVLLCLASDYFDVMFSTNLSENATSYVEFPDKDPKGWALFYNVICPGYHEVVDRSNVEHLIPWFHHFHMVTALKISDRILSQSIKGDAPFIVFVERFQLAKFYGMEEAVYAAETKMKEFLHMFGFSYCIDTISLRGLVSIEPPLQTSELGFVITESFWSELPYLVKKKLKLYPENTLDDIDKLVLWMKECFIYHIREHGKGGVSVGDEVGVKDAGGNDAEAGDH
jgi:hypothetical protein